MGITSHKSPVGDGTSRIFYGKFQVSLATTKCKSSSVNKGHWEEAFRILELVIILVANGSYWCPPVASIFLCSVFLRQELRESLTQTTSGGEGGGNGEEETTFPHINQCEIYIYIYMHADTRMYTHTHLLVLLPFVILVGGRTGSMLQRRPKTLKSDSQFSSRFGLHSCSATHSVTLARLFKSPSLNLICEMGIITFF